MPWAVGEAEENGAFGCVGSEDLVENGLEEENAKVSRTPTAASNSTPGTHCNV